MSPYEFKKKKKSIVKGPFTPLCFQLYNAPSMFFFLLKCSLQFYSKSRIDVPCVCRTKREKSSYWTVGT